MAASSAHPARRPPVIDLCSSDDEDDEVVAVERPRSLPRRRQQGHLPPQPQDPLDLFGDIPAPRDHEPMSTPRAPNQDDGQIIIIDGEEVFLPDMPPDPFNALAIPGAEDNERAATPPTLNRPAGETLIIDGEEVFIPDSPEPQAASSSAPQSTEQPIVVSERMASPMREFTADRCLSEILAIFPDVSHDHVMQLYADMARNTHNNLDGPAKFERIVEKIISSDYPKQGKGKQPLKRKREDDDASDDPGRWGPDRIAEPLHQKTIANILKADFPEFMRKEIDQNVKQHKHLFQTYVSLATTKDMNDSTIVFRGRPGPSLADADTIAVNSPFPALIEELRAARTRVQRDRSERAIAKQKRENEEINLQRAIRAGETSECQACFDDLPMNRQVHCNGEVAHFTCFECMTNYIKTEVGDSRCRVLCTAGCGSGFAPAQLRLLEDKQLLGKLEQLQQEKEIRDAGLDDLEECPFCEYKAILPPIEQDFEFRCANPDCEKVSCRRCKSISHIPQSCEEHAKDNKLDSRHKIEEAMTAAMIRSCNKCKKQFIKDYGCNKMSCPSCGHLQCYVCSASLKDYTHFDNVPGGRPQGGATSNNGKKCPLYDNVEERHEREVKEAEAAARAQVLDDNPDVSEEDLQIKVSETVKKADADRIRRAGQGLPGGHGGFGGAGLFLGVPRRLLGLEADDDGENDDNLEDQENMDAAARLQARLQGVAQRRQDIDELRLAQMRRQRRLMQMAQQRQQEPRPGLGGHIAGHNNQAHLARPPQPVHARGLAHRVPAPVPAGFFIPVHGFNAAQQHVPQPQQQNRFQPPPAPPQPAPQPAPQMPQDQDQAFGNNGPGHILGARNNGLPGAQGLFDAFAEDPFGGGDADPFGFGRMAFGPQFNEMAVPQMDWGNAREQQRQALQNMHNRAGGAGEVRELHRDDPHRYNRGRGFPGAPQTG